MTLKAWALLFCLILMHTPDGGEIYIDASHIVAVRPASQVHLEAIAKGSKTIIYTQDENFAVIEEEPSVVSKVEGCRSR